MRLTNLYTLSSALSNPAFKHHSDKNKPSTLSFKPLKAHTELNIQNLLPSHTLSANSIHQGQCLCTHHTGKTRLGHIHEIAPYENNRLIHTALSTLEYPDSKNIDNLFENRFTWFARGDNLRIKDTSTKDQFSALYDPTSSEYDDLFTTPTHCDIHGYHNRFPVYYFYKVKNLSDKPIDTTLSSGDTLRISPKQAQTLLDLIDSVKIASPGKRDPYISPDDHLSLWISPAVTQNDLQKEIINEYGQLGWRILQRFLCALEKQGHIDLDHFSTNGRVINMAEWRDRYITAAIKKINIIDLLEETLWTVKPADKNIQAILKDKVNQKIESLVASDEIGSKILAFDRFNHFIDLEIFNSLAFYAFQTNQPIAQTKNTKSIALHIRHVLKDLFCTETTNHLLKVLNNGWINLHLLEVDAFRDLIITLYGIDKSGQISGVAGGVQLYIKLPNGFKTAEKTTLKLPPKELSTCIHEMRHAWDWLNNMDQFADYSIDSLPTYSLERRAFHIQNEMLRQLVCSGDIPAKEIRFHHTKAIYRYILSAYPEANSSSKFKQASRDFEKISNQYRNF